MISAYIVSLSDIFPCPQFEMRRTHIYIDILYVIHNVELEAKWEVIPYCYSVFDFFVDPIEEMQLKIELFG